MNQNDPSQPGGSPYPGNTAPDQPLQDGQAPQQQTTAAPTKPKSKTPMIVAGVLALALLVGGGIFAWSLLRGAAPAAAKGLPKETLAMVEVNLNPAAGDKLAVKDLAAKFPILADDMKTAGDDYKAALYNALKQRNTSMPDYEAEVKPWLGDSIALGAVQEGKDGDTNFQPVLSFRVTDKDKAKQFVDKHMSSRTKTFFVDDLMIVTSEQSNLSEESLKNGNLTSNEKYKADMDKLGQGFLATAWVSDDLVKETVKAQHIDLPKSMNFRAAAGIKVEDGALALRTIGWSESTFSKSGEKAAELMSGMPGDWFGSLSTAVQSDAVDKLWEGLQEDRNSRVADSLQQLGITSADDLRTLLGKQVGVSMIIDRNQPKVALKVRTDDPETHKAKIEDVIKRASNGSATGIETTVQGDLVVTTFGIDSDELGSLPKLGDNEAYKKAAKDAGDAQAILWADVPKILDMIEAQNPDAFSPEVKENLAPINGVSMTTKQVDDHYSDMWMRVTTK